MKRIAGTSNRGAFRVKLYGVLKTVCGLAIAALVTVLCLSLWSYAKVARNFGTITDDGAVVSGATSGYGHRHRHRDTRQTTRMAFMLLLTCLPAVRSQCGNPVSMPSTKAIVLDVDSAKVFNIKLNVGPVTGWKSPPMLCSWIRRLLAGRSDHRPYHHRSPLVTREAIPTSWHSSPVLLLLHRDWQAGRAANSVPRDSHSRRYRET
jgi:hypothetical protein